LRANYRVCRIAANAGNEWKTENRKPKTENVKWRELTGFLFSIFGFRFYIAFSVGQFREARRT